MPPACVPLIEIALRLLANAIRGASSRKSYAVSVLSRDHAALCVVNLLCSCKQHRRSSSNPRHVQFCKRHPLRRSGFEILRGQEGPDPAVSRGGDTKLVSQRVNALEYLHYLIGFAPGAYSLLNTVDNNLTFDDIMSPRNISIADVITRNNVLFIISFLAPNTLPHKKRFGHFASTLMESGSKL